MQALKPRPVRLHGAAIQTRYRLPHTHRTRGVHAVGASGSGKSQLLGLIAYSDLRAGTPQVVFDPVGELIDILLTHIGCLPKAERARLWPRVRLIDMSGRGGFSPAWPLLHPLPGDTAKDVADRFLLACRAIDPELASASVQGFNLLRRVGQPVGMILTTLGLQLDQAPDLLMRPDVWESRLGEAVRRDPAVKPAVDVIQQRILPASPAERQRMADPYMAKLEPLLHDPRLASMFCTAPPTVDWQRMDERGETILLDFGGEANEDNRRFKTRWAYDSLLSYVRRRGKGRHRPISIHIDELTELTNQQLLEHDLFARDLDALLNILQRNYALQISAAHQAMWQVSERTQETLLSMGTQIVGTISGFESAMRLAQELCRPSPHRAKRREPVWLSDRDGPFVVHERIIDYPLPEQLTAAAYVLMDLKPFEFLVRPRGARNLMRISIRPDVGRPWPSDHVEALAHIRHQLQLRDAMTVTATVRQPSPLPLAAAPLEVSTPFDTMDDDGYDDYFDDA